LGSRSMMVSSTRTGPQLCRTIARTLNTKS
jgi:hypothetical protein